MKKLFYLIPFLFLIIISGCDKVTDVICPENEAPGPPYGTPDDKDTYTSTNGYKSVTYTYYCLASKGNKYVSITYTRTKDCEPWKQTSEFTSSGICGE